MAKKKLKNYEVLVTAFATVLVLEAESEEKAMEYATDELRMGDLQLDEASVKCEIKTAEDLDRARRHADAIAKNV